MPTIEFTENHEDLSADQGFQFKFYCERCGDGFTSSFQNDALGVRKCRRCGNWLCEVTCWNLSASMCKQCAPVAEEASMRAEHVRSHERSLRRREPPEREGQGSGGQVPGLRRGHPGQEVLSRMRAKVAVDAFCPGCGAKATPGARFCGDRGGAFGGDRPAAVLESSQSAAETNKRK